jgi:hypothetical protein
LTSPFYHEDPSDRLSATGGVAVGLSWSKLRTGSEGHIEKLNGDKRLQESNERFEVKYERPFQKADIMLSVP